MVTRLKQPHVSSSSTETSSEAMSSLKGDNGRRDTTERRLTKPKTNSGTSLISQRSIQPSIAAPPIRPNGLRRDTSNDTLANSFSNDEDEEQDKVNGRDVWASVPRATLRAHYKLHNPLGPRWYRNHHLIPPSHFKPSMRPPTFFSTSFPPIGIVSHDYPDDDEDPSRSPSHSPLPTPESSQTRVQDGSKPRSRKTSQTAPDAIDMLDFSDPWGQNWHHQSPYEFCQSTTIASFDTTDLPNRTRRASFSVAHARQSSVAPSPLSQSTSAVNLPSLQPEIKPPRKLSKRKTTNVTTIFQDPPPQVDRRAASVPTTPIDAPVLPSAPVTSDILPKGMSTSPAGPFLSTPSPTLKREKRGSLLNRLVKKFSTLKRGSEPTLSGIEGWNYEASSTTIHRRETTSVAGNTYVFPEKPDSSGDRPDEEKSVHPQQEDDRASLSSLDIPYSIMGKLTVVNPDLSDEETQPIAAKNPTQIHPPELDNEDSPNPPQHDKEGSPSPEPPEPVPDDTFAFPSDAEPETNLDKPLPPRLDMPRFSRLVMSDITISTPQAMEQPLPPLPPKDVILQESSVREAPPSSPDHGPEPPESPTFDPFHIVNSISLDHTAHEQPPPSPIPVQTQVAPESLKNALSQRKSASPPKENPNKPVVERRHTQSPPAATTVQRDLGRQPPNRNAAPSPVVTPTSDRKTGSVRSVNDHVSPSSRDLPAEFKSPSPHTRSRSNSRPEPRSVPAPVLIPPQVLVPFPASIEQRRPFHADSPVSTSSMLANPPTPYDHRISISVSDRSSIPPTVPPKSVRHQSPPPPRTTGTIKRQTETFKLVRSSSGNVNATNQTILAQGQQWEVVESVETTKKDKSLRLKMDEKKSKDQEREIDREREREKELERERERQRARERDLEGEKQRARDREIELQKERERREAERIQRELEIKREKERVKERERREEERIQRELEEQREQERAKERERLQKELELQREWERTRELERREKEREKERQREREKEKERERELARQQEREAERQRHREKDRERGHRERGYRERERRGEERERMREIEKESEKRKERERRERDKAKEKERESRREREREKDREREEKARWERERERSRKVRERTHEEDPDRRSGRNGRKSREYERRSRDYEPRTEVSDHRSPRARDSDRRPTGYDQGSKRESRPHEKSISRHNGPHDNHSHSRKYDEHRDRSTRHPTDMSSPPYSQHPPAPAIQPVPIPEPRLQRMPSVSTRPMSQLPSADEMNAVRAKEQWEMERLWKGRSLYGLEPNGTANHVIPGHSSTSSMSDDIPEIIPASPPQIHGSSHTAYLVQPSFHDSRPQIYRSMPSVPPPIYYLNHSPAPGSIPSIPDSISSYEPYETLRFYPGPAQVAEPLPVPSFLPNSNNPLPEPPRESSYKPTLLPPMSPSKKRSTEYWTFNGITTAH